MKSYTQSEPRRAPSQPDALGQNRGTPVALPLPTAAAWSALVTKYGNELASFAVSAVQAGQNGFDFWREWIAGTGYLRRLFHTADFDAAGHGVAVQHLAGVFHQARREAAHLATPRGSYASRPP